MSPIPRAIKWLHKKISAWFTLSKTHLSMDSKIMYTDTTIDFTPGLCLLLYVHIYTQYISTLSTCLQSHLSCSGFCILPSIDGTYLRYPLQFIESYFDTGTAASILCIIHISRNMSSLWSFKSQALKHCMIAIVTVHNPLWGFFFFF